MSKYTERAVALFNSGFNCSQSVFAAFCDKFDMPEELALKVAAGLGGGVGRLREVCGAVCGAAMVAGMVYGATEGSDRASKTLTYQKVQEIAAEFRKTNPSIVCRELLGISKAAPTPATPDARTAEYYKKRPCPKIVEDAARAAEKVLFGEEEEDTSCKN